MINIIIPVYHSLSTLRRALNSVQGQTHKDFCVTIIQDGDGEDYSSIIAPFVQEGLDIRLLLSPHNIGPGAARQIGIDAAYGDSRIDYLLFLDADDFLMPRALSTLYKVANQYNLDLATSDVYSEYLGGGGTFQDCTSTPITWLHGNLYRKEYLRSINLKFLNGLNINEDTYFNLVAFNCTENSKTISELTYVWTANPNSITNQSRKKFEIGCNALITAELQGLKKLEKVMGKIDPYITAMSLIQVYQQIEIAKYLHYTPTADLSLLKNRIVVDAVHTQEFWKTVAEQLYSYTSYNNTLIFYQTPFKAWLEANLRGK